jgi:Mlc titration factor MtfA (ptsG expression regulator)
MFSWFHDHRRREIVSQPFPADWTEFLRTNVGYDTLLSATEQAKLREDIQILIAEKNWEGAGGMVMTSEVQVTIAAQAALLLLGWEHAEFKGVESILVYPSGYVAREPNRLWNSSISVITEGPSARLGQATGSGTVILSWDDALKAGHNPASPHNVVLHEFAHMLDAQDGIFDGAPPLHDDTFASEWTQVMTEEYETLVDQVQHGHHTLIDPYGATNAAEFFAVVTELFFGHPQKMHDSHPRLYELLRHFYQQDTAARFERAL